MKVFIGNFGRENWAWSECYKRNAIAVIDDIRLHKFWAAGDREGYIAEAQKYYRQPDKSPLQKTVASRWFGVNNTIINTKNDIWIHREKEELWWTVSLDVIPEKEELDDPKPKTAFTRIFIFYKPCTPWSERDKNGKRLTWSGLHPKARDFLFTEGTCQQLSHDNADYALALINGDDLTPWHNRPDWKAKAETRKFSEVRVFNSRKKSIARMAFTAFQTAKDSGKGSISIKKSKGFFFTDQYELEKYIEELLEAQEGLCALTGIRLLFDGDDGNKEFLCSLDRINSSGNYERGNLQVVCKFANRWKSDTDNDVFMGLLDAVVSAVNGL